MTQYFIQFPLTECETFHLGPLHKTFTKPRPQTKASDKVAEFFFNHIQPNKMQIIRFMLESSTSENPEITPWDEGTPQLCCQGKAGSGGSKNVFYKKNTRTKVCPK